MFDSWTQVDNNKFIPCYNKIVSQRRASRTGYYSQARCSFAYNFADFCFCSSAISDPDSPGFSLLVGYLESLRDNEISLNIFCQDFLDWLLFCTQPIKIFKEYSKTFHYPSFSQRPTTDKGLDKNWAWDWQQCWYFDWQFTLINWQPAWTTCLNV